MSARNSPAPDSSLQDGLLYSSSGRGRKTRNSAESVFYDVDLEALLRRNSRRGKAAKNAPKETQDVERGSNIGDESSQDGMASESRASAGALDREASKEEEVLNGKSGGEEGGNPLRTNCDRELEKESKCDICDKNSVTDHASHSYLCPGDSSQCTATSQMLHIKTDPDDKPCHNISAMKDSGSSNNQLIQAYVTKTESGANDEPVLVNSSLSGDKCININSFHKCDTDSPSARKENPSSPQDPFAATVTDCPDTIKKESCVDDSGFVSCQTSPHSYEGRVSPDNHRDSAANGDKSKCTLQSNTTTITVQESVADPGDGNVCGKAKDGDIKEKVCGSGNDGDGINALVKESCSPEDGNPFMATELLDNEGADASLASPGKPPQAAFNALMDHDAYSEEEMVSCYL